MESWAAFWNVVMDVWKNGLFGIDIGRITMAVFIFLGFLIIRRIFSRVLVHRISLLTRKTSTPLDDHALEVVLKPVSFIPVVAGAHFAMEHLNLSGSPEIFADRLIRSLIVFVIFWGLVRLVQPLSILLHGLERVLSTPMVEWFIKAVRIAFVLIGGATILETWGIRVGPIIAGLGLFGVAVALGAQDLFKNLISGMLVLAEKRFHPGDWIKVRGVVEGTVETIGFRSTVVRRFDKAPVYVPNSKLADDSLINYSAMTHRRIYWIIGVEYRTTIEQLRRIRDRIEEYILQSEAFAHPPEVSTFVRIDRFGDSSIDIMLYCFTRTIDWGEWLKLKEQLAYRVKEIVEEAGTGFAFPSQSVYVETLPEENPEIFVPPET
ncbi:MAG: mechanosensitive ion channel protein MscS [Desulfobacteraceae bacterium 4572_87]|nr:MAG: mechanosensitive ion channel protein MscS [Desulfobacteraceae bacterium 4572_87]